jgi:[ribosomal protein S18]-alanine N-acetyltransferase
MYVRRLRRGDEAIVERLATREPQTALLDDPHTIFLVAFDDEAPLGFVLAHELPRRHGDPTQLLVYEVDVDESHRRRGVGKALLGELASIARERGIVEGWVLTDADNEAAMALYRSAGGILPQEATMWEFRYTQD